MNAGDSSESVREVRVIAPINIALVKYWGKRNEDLMLPLNDSISLSINDVCAETRIRTGPSIKEDSLSINGSDVSLMEHPRFLRCFGIVSETSFPVEAGLASSAAGFAAIAYGLGQMYQLGINDIIRIARLGSGSACRSVLSGLVHWKAGSKEDGTDCICETVFGEDYWPTLRAIIVVTSRNAKEIGSSLGMRTTVKTSKLLQARIDGIPERINRLKDAFRARDFEKLAEIIMLESGQLHAVCMDTMPPLKYLSDSSWYLMRLVHAFNEHCKSTKLAYTFDAGPNCCLFTEVENVPSVLAAINKYCKLPSDLIEQVADCSAAHEYENLKCLMQEKQESLVLFRAKHDENDGTMDKPLEPMENVVKDLFLSSVGAGPVILGINGE